MNMSNITYHREKPVREFDLNQTMYTTIKSVNESNQNIDAIGFLGKNITYGELFKRVDRLADAYHKAGVQEGDTIAIATINMPIVQENLLALSKLGVTSKWIDLRAKKAELIKNINESNCKIIVIFEGITPLIEEIINETSIEKVIVASPKDYLNPFIKILANLKQKGYSTEKAYLTEILPEKMKHNLNYLKRFSIKEDISLCFKTLFHKK